MELLAMLGTTGQQNECFKRFQKDSMQVQLDRSNV